MLLLEQYKPVEYTKREQNDDELKDTLRHHLANDESVNTSTTNDDTVSPNAIIKLHPYSSGEVLITKPKAPSAGTADAELANKYMDLYAESIVDEYKIREENAALHKNLDDVMTKMTKIRNELSELRQVTTSVPDHTALRQTDKADTMQKQEDSERPHSGKQQSKTKVKFKRRRHEARRCRRRCVEDKQTPKQAPPTQPYKAQEPQPIQTQTAEPIWLPRHPEPTTRLNASQPEHSDNRETETDKEKKHKNKAAVTISNILFYSLLALFLISAVLFIASDDVSQSLFGYRYFHITTPSMEPDLPAGSVVFTSPVLASEIRVGDDITVNVGGGHSDTFLTHRVVEVIEDVQGKRFFQTQGINNQTNDPTPFSEDLLVGKVALSIPNLGTVMTIVQEQLVLLIIGLIFLVALAFSVRLLFAKDPEQERVEEFSKKQLELIREQMQEEKLKNPHR